jgi:hypothetical protein
MAEFFDVYAPYVALINSRLFPDAVTEGLKLLREAKRFAPAEYERTPKGTPFYLLGIAAFMSHDYQTGAFLVDAAISEDLKHNPTNPNTPALLFMDLNDKNRDQAAFPIVESVVAKLNIAVSNYNGRSGSNSLTLPELRRLFFSHVLVSKRPHLRTLTTAFLSYFFEWGHRSTLIDLSEAGSNEPFYIHLFKGCLLFESLLKENPMKRPTKKMLGPILKTELFRELSISSSVQTSSPGLEAILRSLKPGEPVETAIEWACKTRNTLGHNLAWQAASLNATKYDLLADNIAASCLHAISRLYR